VEELAHSVLTQAGLSPKDVGVLATLDVKADEAALQDLARAWSVELRVFHAARLEAETPRLANPSDAVFALMGCHGVAEAAALACVGPEGLLLVPKVKGTSATAALAGWL
jgi:cobalt-precorrin 5A hydrolase/precorrin-3B C17-methyltransferase